MGLKYTNFFDNYNYESSDTQILICKNCSSHLCLSHLILSDNFTSTTGSAYLVDKLINYQPDPVLEKSNMRTGLYLTNKVRCHQCQSPLGWSYKKAYLTAQSYKEGKFVLEESVIKVIPNNSSTATLLEKARINNQRRRYSGESNSSTSLMDCSPVPEGLFKFKSPNSEQEAVSVPGRL